MDNNLIPISINCIFYRYNTFILNFSGLSQQSTSAENASPSLVWQRNLRDGIFRNKVNKKPASVLKLLRAEEVRGTHCSHTSLSGGVRHLERKRRGAGNKAWATAVICGENYSKEDGPIFQGCGLWAGLQQCCLSAPRHRNISLLKDKAAAHRQSINVCTRVQGKQNRTCP